MVKTLFNKYGMRVELNPFKVNGKTEEYLRIVGPDVVVILAIDHDSILLERQYRYAVTKYLYEIPAGIINKGETAVQAVRRELLEETGYEPVKTTLLFKAYEAPGRIKSMFYFFLVEGVRTGKKDLDPGEIITSKWVSKKQFDTMIRSGKIIDLKTIGIYTYYNNYISK